MGCSDVRRVSKAAPVRPGDKVGVCAPAGPVDRDRLEDGIRAMEGWGWRVVRAPHLYERSGYLAGSDADRAADLNRMIADPELAAIVLARGGYGCMRLLDRLDFSPLRTAPKAIVGFSDITALHLAVSKEAGLVTFHGPLACTDEGEPPFNRAELRRALTEAEPLGDVTVPAEGPSLRTVVPGSATGTLAGGNLSLLSATLGTPYEVDTRGAVLLIEEVDEEPYRIDRMLTQLHLAGKLQQAKAFLIGECVGCDPAPGELPQPNAYEVFADRLAPLGRPALWGFPCGHGRLRATLPLGVRVTVDATERRLRVEEAALRAVQHE